MTDGGRYSAAQVSTAVWKLLVAVDAVAGGIVPVEADGVDGGAGVSADVSQEGVGEQRGAAEGGSDIFAETEHALLVGDKYQLADGGGIFPVYLANVLSGVKENFLQITRCAPAVL